MKDPVNLIRVELREVKFYVSYQYKSYRLTPPNINCIKAGWQGRKPLEQIEKLLTLKESFITVDFILRYDLKDILVKDN